jgi:hypothetical protein
VLETGHFLVAKVRSIQRANQHDVELQLQISLLRKAYGCPALVDVSILDVTEGELIAARHSSYGMSLTTFDLGPLTPAEQEALDATRERVFWPSNQQIPA